MSRIDLAANYPLPAPLVLFVEPTNVCNFRCGICPESLPGYAEEAGYYQKMSIATWSRVVSSLQGWCKPVVRFYFVGEPLLNRQLPDMIAAASALGCRTELTTNASLLDRHWASRLLECGLDYLRVSVYGTTDADYERETGKPSTLFRVIGNIMQLRKQRGSGTLPHIHAELVTRGDWEELDRFQEQWVPIADTIGVKALHNWGASLVQLGVMPLMEKQVCPYPFFELFVKANGDVTVCCVDWDGKLVVGNVNTETLRQIWEGPRLAEIRGVHLAGQRKKLPSCRDCNVLNACPDNLDSLVPSPVPRCCQMNAATHTEAFQCICGAEWEPGESGWKERVLTSHS